MAFEGKTVPIYTFTQLEQIPRQRLKNRAMDLRDLVGEDRLPPLRAGGSVDVVLSWILEVQCALLKSTGLDLTVQDLGKPRGYGEDAEGNYFGNGAAPSKAAPQRQPMQDVIQGGGSEASAAYEQAVQQAAAIRQRNQGSNIFG